MPEASSRGIQGQLRAIFAGGAAGQLGDEQLLARFLASRGEAAEAAFAALVERHGGMVLGVCRRVLGDAHEAEDAFQATFLVLARKAATVARRERLFPWLYKVALRTAREARDREGRRRERERRVAAMPPIDQPDPAEAGELAAVLDEELSRLPERYRSAVLLCELEGLSRRESAGRLGVPEATFASRLARARARLRDALTRRGVAPSGAALSALLAREARAVIVPPTLVGSTSRAAALVAAGSSAAGLVSIPVATLTEGVLKAMLIAKLRGVALGLAALALVATGVTATFGQLGPNQGFGAGGPPPGFDAGQAPVESRLDSVEKKLDRILDAMGATGGAANPQNAGRTQQPPPTVMLVDPRGADGRTVSAASSDLARYGPMDAMPANAGNVANRAMQAVPGQAGSPLESLYDRTTQIEYKLHRLEGQVAEVIRRLDRLENEGRKAEGDVVHPQM